MFQPAQSHRVPVARYLLISQRAGAQTHSSNSKKKNGTQGIVHSFFYLFIPFFLPYLREPKNDQQRGCSDYLATLENLVTL